MRLLAPPAPRAKREARVDASSLLQSPPEASSSLRKEDKDLAASVCAVDEAGTGHGPGAAPRTPH